jgi:hypothetical protein
MLTIKHYTNYEEILLNSNPNWIAGFTKGTLR